MKDYRAPWYIGDGQPHRAAAPGQEHDARPYRQLASIEKLPKRDQEALLRTIDAFLTKAS